MRRSRNRSLFRPRPSECQEYTVLYNRAQSNGLINPLPPYTLCPSYGWLVPQGSNLDFSMNNIVYIGATNYNPGPCGSSYGCFVTPMAFCQLWSMRTQGAGGTENHLLGMLARLKNNVPNINCGPTQPMAVPMARIGRGLSDNRMNRYKRLRG
jgi:hypothetical protein